MIPTTCPHCGGQLHRAAVKPETAWECLSCERVWFFVYTTGGES